LFYTLIMLQSSSVNRKSLSPKHSKNNKRKQVLPKVKNHDIGKDSIINIKEAKFNIKYGHYHVFFPDTSHVFSALSHLISILTMLTTSEGKSEKNNLIPIHDLKVYSKVTLLGTTVYIRNTPAVLDILDYMVYKNYSLIHTYVIHFELKDRQEQNKLPGHNENPDAPLVSILEKTVTLDINLAEVIQQFVDSITYTIL